MGVTATGKTNVRKQVRLALAAIDASGGGAIATIYRDGDPLGAKRVYGRHADVFIRMGEKVRRTLGSAGKSKAIPGICYVDIKGPATEAAGKLEIAGDQVADTFSAGNAAIDNVRYGDADSDYKGVARSPDGSGKRAEGEGTGYHVVRVTIPFTLYEDG